MKLTEIQHVYYVPPCTIAAVLVVVLALFICVLAYIRPIIVTECASSEQCLDSFDNAILCKYFRSKKLSNTRRQVFFASLIRGKISDKWTMTLLFLSYHRHAADVQRIPNCGEIQTQFFFLIKYWKFRITATSAPGLLSSWGAYDALRPLVWWGGVHSLPIPHPLNAFGVSVSALSAPQSRRPLAYSVSPGSWGASWDTLL